MTIRSVGPFLAVVGALTLVLAIAWKRNQDGAGPHKHVLLPPPLAAAGADPQSTAALPPGEAQALRNMQVPPQAEIRPVYPAKLEGEPDPRAQRFCAAIHDLPAKKRAECCSTTPGTVLTEGCVRLLTYALRSKALLLGEDALSQCEAAMRDSVRDCTWVGFLPPPLPAACLAALQGALPGGARCRSSLECRAGLRCQGVGPTETGTCGAPLADGQRCATAVDALGAYTRWDQLDRAHPECQGFCGRLHVCEKPLPLGADCVMSAQCGPGHRCGAGKCIAGAFGQLDQPCVGGDCAAGLRCTRLRCIKPAAAGAPCANDFDCLGGCLRPKGASELAPGQCGPRCN